MNEFLRSEIWSRWLELRKKPAGGKNKQEVREYDRLEPVVCRELAKIHNYIPVKIKTVKNETLSNSEQNASRLSYGEG